MHTAKNGTQERILNFIIISETKKKSDNSNMTLSKRIGKANEDNF